MNRPTLRLASGLVALSFLPGATPVEAQRWPMDSATRARVDEVFDWIGRDAPGCALGVMRDGRLAYARGYGLANLDWGIPIGPTTVFDIGSVSKQFTAAAVALLDLEGVLSLDDDVRRWIPELPEYGRAITIRHLLNHTSGIRDYLTLMDLQGRDFANVFDELDGVELITRQQGLNFEPGSEYLYSNSGYLLLANVVRRATGTSVRRFLEARFFDPLGMAHTSVWDDSGEVLAHRATGYAPGDDGWRIDHAWNFQMGGDGQVITSVDDLLRWDALFYEPVVGGPGLLEHLHTRGVLNGGDTIPYALGLNVDEHRGLRRVRHGGSWAGFRAHLVRFPGEHTSVSVLCNRADADAGGSAMAVAEVVLGDALAPRDPVAQEGAGAGGGGPGGEAAEPAAPFEATRAQLERWVGVYRTPDRPNYWRFELRDGALHLLLPNEAVPLTPLSETRFVAERYGIPVGFQPETDEWPEGVRVGSTVFLRQPPVELSPSDQRALAGRYRSEELAVAYEISLEEGGLVLHRPNRDPRAFVPAAEGEFESGGVAYLLERDAAGRPAGFRVHAGRVTDILFERVRDPGEQGR